MHIDLEECKLYKLNSTLNLNKTQEQAYKCHTEYRVLLIDHYCSLKSLLLLYKFVHFCVIFSMATRSIFLHKI